MKNKEERVETPFSMRNAAFSRTMIQALESRGFEAYYCENGSDAVAKALELIPQGSSIAYGGSYTVKQLGLLEHFRNDRFTLFDRDLASSPEERDRLQHAAFTADWFIAGTNAVSQDGILVNIDCNGNRVAPMLYGPKNVLLMIGMNKITADLDSALKRARNTAAPVNMARFAGRNTPCKVTGVCADCKSPDSICADFTQIRLCRPAGRIKVILIGEDLGF